MGCVRLERIEPQTDKRRYRLVTWARTLWNTWAVGRQWGRIDQPVRGTRIDKCATEEEALRRAAERVDLWLRHKYIVKSSNTGDNRVHRRRSESPPTGTARRLVDDKEAHTCQPAVWIDARQRYRLTHAQMQMAWELEYKARDGMLDGADELLARIEAAYEQAKAALVALRKE